MDVDDGIDGTPPPSPRGYRSVPGTIDRYTTPEAAEFRTTAAARRYRERLERERLHLQREREHAIPRDPRRARENPRRPVRGGRRREATPAPRRRPPPAPPAERRRSARHQTDDNPDIGYEKANQALSTGPNAVDWHPLSMIKDKPKGLFLVMSAAGDHVGVYGRGSLWNPNDGVWGSEIPKGDGFEYVCRGARPLLARQQGALNFGDDGTCHLVSMCIYWAMKDPDGLTDMLQMDGRAFVRKYAKGNTRHILQNYGLI